MAEPDDMKLPPGRVCSDCTHWRRCRALIWTLCPMGGWCDFAPSRYRERRDG